MATEPAERSSGQAIAPAATARLATLAVVLGVPAFVLVSVPNVLNQAAMIDPFVYTGYIHSYHELLARFGRTYYSTRIAFIHPARALIALFGESAGYVALRYLALVLALGSIWSIARRYYGPRVAAFSVVFAAFQPLFVRSLLWDYVDGFATTYLLAGAACLIGLSKNPGPALWFWAGACLALATNSHPFTLAVGGAFLPAWLLLQPTDWSMRRRAAAVASVAAGFVAITLVLATILRLELPIGSGFYDSTSVNMSLYLLRGGNAAWFAPWSAIHVEYRFFVLTPLFFAVLLAVIVLRPTWKRHLAQPRLCAAALVYAAAVYAFYVVMHVVFRGGVFVTWYVLTYLFPAMALCVICGVGECAARAGGRGTTFLWWSAGAYAVLWLASGPLGPVMNRVPFSAIGFGALLILVLVALWRTPAMPLAAVLAASVASPLTAYRAGSDYQRMHSRPYHVVETITYHAALYLMHIVGSLPDRDQPIVFWYPAEQHQPGARYFSLDSVQSTYLWGFTRLAGANGLPVLDAVSRNQLNQASRIVLLAKGQGEIERHRRSLDDAGVVTRTIEDDRFEESGFGYRTVVLDRLSPASTTIFTSLPLRAFQPANGGALVDAGRGVVLTTPPVQWAYAAVARMPPPSKPRSGATVRLRVRVTKGLLGIGVAPTGDISRFLSETSVPPSESPQEISIDVASAGSIVLRSQAPGGVATRADLLAMDLEELAPRAEPDVLVTAVPLGSIQAQNGSALALANGALRLATAPRRWVYAAAARLPLPHHAQGAATLRVRVQVIDGQLGVGVTSAGDSTQFISERSLKPTGRPIEVAIDVPEVMQMDSVVFRSWAPPEVATRAEILSVELHQASDRSRVSKRSVPLVSLQPVNGGRLARAADDSIRLTTPTVPWSFAAAASLKDPGASQGAGTIVVRTHVASGRLSIGVTPLGDSTRFINERLVDQSPEPVDARVDVADVDKVDAIVFRSAASKGTTTDAQILSIDVEHKLDFSTFEAVPLASVQARDPSALIRARDGSLALTSAIQWAFAATARVPVPPGATGAAVVRVRVHVGDGQLGVAVTPAGDTSRFLAEQSTVTTSAPVDISLDVPDITKVGDVVFRSWTPTGTPTRAHILAIEIVRPHS